MTSGRPIRRITSILVGTILAAACGLLGPLGPAHRSSSAQAAAGPQGGVNYLDPTFGDHGITTIHSPDGGATLDALALRPDGKIVVAGRYRDDIMVARYTTSGALDTTFGGTGIVTTTMGMGSLSYATAIALQTDNKVVVGGAISGDFALVRFTADGDLDTSFGGTGVVTTSIDMQSNDAVEALALQTDGKIVVVGSSEGSRPSSSRIVLARFTASGALDATFSGGITNTSLDNNADGGAALALEPDGKIVVAGTAEPDFGVNRFTAGGVLDTSFGGGDGVVTTNMGPNTFSYVTEIALQADGKLVAAGAKLDSRPPFSYFALARYTADGNLDDTFGEAGIVTTDIDRADDRAHALALQPDGKLVAAGRSSSICSSTCDWRFTLARYRRDGQLDRTFGGDGIITSDTRGIIYAVGLQPDGKLVAAGTATAPPLFGIPPVAILARYVDNAGAVFLPLVRT